MTLAFDKVYTSVIGNNNTTRNTTMPASGGPVDGALLVGLIGTCKGSNATHTAASGFSAADIDQAAGANASDMYLSTYHKTAASESGTVYTWTTSPASPIVAAVLGWTGQDTTAPIVNVVESHDTTVLTGGVTTPKDGCYVVVWAQMFTGSNTVTGVSDVAGNTYSAAQLDTVNLVDNLLTTNGTNDVNLYCYMALVPTGSATGQITVAVSGTATNNAVGAFVVQPSGGSTGVAASDNATLSMTASLSGNSSAVSASDSATLDDSTSDLSIDDGQPDFTVTDVASVLFSPTGSDSFTLTDSSSVATTVPSASDAFTLSDLSQITIQGADPSSSDLFTVTDVASLDNSEPVTATDLFTVDDEALTVEVGFPSLSRATVTIVSPRGTVTLSEG